MYPEVKRATLKVLETATSSFPKEYKMHKVAKVLSAGSWYRGYGSVVLPVSG